MTPFEYARAVVPVDCAGRMFFVSLSGTSLKIPIEMTPSSQRADLVALIARQIIAGQIVEALKNEDCRIAALSDDGFLAGRINNPLEVSQLCREQAQLHTVDCITVCPNELTQITERL